MPACKIQVSQLPAVVSVAILPYVQNGAEDSAAYLSLSASRRITHQAPAQSAQQSREVQGGTQAVREQAGAEAENDAAGTEGDRRARLQAGPTARLAYDAEQRQLRDAVVQQLHGGGTSSDDDEGAAEVVSDGAAGLTLKQRGAPMLKV